MTLCVNDSGTWRNISFVCTRVGYTWRTPIKGCINASGTWRQFHALTLAQAPLGACMCGGNVIHKSSGTAWIVNPPSACIRVTWHNRSQAVTCSQTVTGCSGWFIPTCAQFKNPVWCGKNYICSSPGAFWTDTSYNSGFAQIIYSGSPYTLNELQKSRSYGVRAFRTVSY